MNDLSKDACFEQLARVADAMTATHGEDFAMGALVLAARFIAERQARRGTGRDVPEHDAVAMPAEAAAPAA